MIALLLSLMLETKEPIDRFPQFPSAKQVKDRQVDIGFLICQIRRTRNFVLEPEIPELERFNYILSLVYALQHVGPSSSAEAEMELRGLLGDDVFESGFSFQRSTR